MDRSEIERVLQGICPENGTGLAAGVFRDGTLLDSFTFGYANVERALPITLDTSFHVASLSKQFTAYAIALLNARGQLFLDQSVCAILPELGVDAGITVRHLVHHTSGLRDQWDTLDLMGWRDGDPIETDDILRLVVPLADLNHEPGSRYLYCNTGYTLMGEIVRRTTGVSLAVFLNREVFRPLGMSGTRFREDYRVARSNEADCYTRQDGTYAPTTPAFRTTGASSLQTTLPDFAKWIAYLSDIENSELHSHMHRGGQLGSGEEISYGFGRVAGILGAQPVLSHGGIDADFSAHFFYVPERRIGAAIVSNGTHLALEAMTAWLLARYEPFDEKITAELERAVSFYPSPGPRKDAGEWEQIAVFGALEIGDLRVLEQRANDLRLTGTVSTRLHPIGGQAFAVEGSLSVYVMEPSSGSLKLSSSTAGVDLTFPQLEQISALDFSECAGIYQSTQLDGRHKIVFKDGALFWQRPRLPLRPIRHAGGRLFHCDGFLLQIDEDRLTVSHARAHGFVFERVGDRRISFLEAAKK